MADEKILNLGSSKIFYRVMGEGSAVVLLHGIPVDGNLWQRECTSLERFRLIVPDLPGSGLSGMIADMSIEGMARSVKAILDEEKIARSVVIGHSLGGYISLAFAEIFPDRLSGLGLFHSTAYPDSEERRANRRKAIDFIRKNGAFEFLKTSVPNLFSPAHRENNAGYIDELIANANTFSSQTLISYYEAMISRRGRMDVLTRLKVPLLFIAGQDDSAAPLDDILEQCHLPDICDFHILEKSGHMGMLEEPEKTRLILKNYLETL